MTYGEATEDEDEAEVELASIAAIFPELTISPDYKRKASLELEVTPTRPLSVNFHALLNIDSLRVDDGKRSPPHIRHPEIHSVVLKHLPSLRVDIELPEGYPESQPAVFRLYSDPDWLPRSEILRLQDAGRSLWEDYGRTPIVYAYIDCLQTEIEHGFELKEDSVILDESFEQPLIDHDKRIKRNKFNAKTYDCGVCLYPKRGSACHQLRHCGHIFCVQCLTDCYTSAINEGDVSIVKCMDPTCGRPAGKGRMKRMLHPTELLDIPIDRKTVQRFVELQLKKMLESDKSTVYCPRQWCQTPARSAKYAKFNTEDLSSWPDWGDDEPRLIARNDVSAEKFESDEPNTERLAICSNSRCQFAFCNYCHRSWHGDSVRCRPKPTKVLAEEEQASLDYILQNTTPCPQCNVGSQKVFGCNHMICFQCSTHYCYICSAWLDKANPYKHFNTRGLPCYQRLFEGDDGSEVIDFFGPRAAEAQAIAAAQETAAPEGVAVAAQAGPNEPVPAPLPAADALANARRPNVRDVRVPALPVLNLHVDDLNRQGLARFLELAADDAEDGWESDELEVA